MKLIALLLLWAQDLPQPLASDRLQAVVGKALDRALEQLSDEKWDRNQIAVTVIDLKVPERPEIGEYHGSERFYPASVIKMCYMAATFEWERRGEVRLDEAYWKDLREMIGPSSNKATQRIVDRLCGTTDGPALEGKAYEEFVHKRNGINRWLHTLGLTSLNACQKTYDGDERSPRDQQFLRGGKSSGPLTNRNAMTTHDTALLLFWIGVGRIVDAEACAKMLELMRRDLKTYPGDAKKALGGAPEGSKVWAKSGWVKNECHEASLIELPTGRRLVVVVFTTGREYKGTLIAQVVREVCQEIVH